MGFAPPIDGPDPAEQAFISADAGFQAGPPVVSLCGFKLPSFLFFLKFKLPSLNFPPPLPSFSLNIGLSCDLNNPLNVSGGISFGGGRKPNGPPDPDELDT